MVTDWVVVGAGPSVTPDQVEHVRGKAHVIACNNAWQLVPWADAMCACDLKWWTHYGLDTQEFGGRRFAPRLMNGISHLRTRDHPTGCNTGLYAMLIARELGAKRIILLGIDLNGTHFFGRHPSNLKNADEARHARHRQQFSLFHGADVVNCSPESSLEVFEKNSIFSII